MTTFSPLLGNVYPLCAEILDPLLQTWKYLKHITVPALIEGGFSSSKSADLFKWNFKISFFLFFPITINNYRIFPKY